MNETNNNNDKENSTPKSDENVLQITGKTNDDKSNQRILQLSTDFGVDANAIHQKAMEKEKNSMDKETTIEQLMYSKLKSKTESIEFKKM